MCGIKPPNIACRALGRCCHPVCAMVPEKLVPACMLCHGCPLESDCLSARHTCCNMSMHACKLPTCCQRQQQPLCHNQMMIGPHAELMNYVHGGVCKETALI